VDPVSRSPCLRSARSSGGDLPFAAQGANVSNSHGADLQKFGSLSAFGRFRLQLLIGFLNAAVQRPELDHSCIRPTTARAHFFLQIFT